MDTGIGIAVIGLTCRPLSQATKLSAAFRETTVLPDRFHASSLPVPGQSVVPPEYGSTSSPDAAAVVFTQPRPDSE